MKQNWFVLPIILVVVLLLAFLLAFFLDQPPIVEDEAEYVEVDGDDYLDYDYISPEEVGIGEFEEFGPSGDYFVPSNLSECESFEGSEREQCYGLYAIFYEDESGCEAASDISIRDDCFARIAEVKKDPDLCGKVVTGSTECYTTLAIETNNSSLCEKGKREIEACYKAAASGKYSDCVDGFEKRFCNDAATSKDPGICEQMNDYSQICYYTIAKNTGQSSLCNKAGAARNTCFFQVALKLNNEAICENLTDTRDNCVAWVAFNTRNKQLCYKAGSEAQSCIEDIELS